MASAPPLGVASTLALIAAGLFVVPAIMLALTIPLLSAEVEPGVELSTPDAADVALEPSPQAQ